LCFVLQLLLFLWRMCCCGWRSAAAFLSKFYSMYLPYFLMFKFKIITLVCVNIVILQNNKNCLFLQVLLLVQTLLIWFMSIFGVHLLWPPFMAILTFWPLLMIILDIHGSISWKINQKGKHLLQHFISLIHTQFHVIVKVNRSDNGAEFHCPFFYEPLGIWHYSPNFLCWNASTKFNCWAQT